MGRRSRVSTNSCRSSSRQSLSHRRPFPTSESRSFTPVGSYKRTCCCTTTEAADATAPAKVAISAWFDGRIRFDDHVVKTEQ
jgi:hypothetical protein